MSWLCVTRTVTLPLALTCWNVLPLSVDKSKSTSEPKLCVSVTPKAGGRKFCVKNRWRTSRMMIPAAYNWWNKAGLIYTLPGGGNTGDGKKYSGAGGSTVTVKLQVAVWPQASLAVQVTVVVPTGKVLPLGGLQVTVTGGQPPLAELV